MGLAIVRKNVETVGGALTLESKPDAGCIFRFSWPKEPSKAKLEQALENLSL